MQWDNLPVLVVKRDGKALGDGDPRHDGGTVISRGCSAACPWHLLWILPAVASSGLLSCPASHHPPHPQMPTPTVGTAWGVSSDDGSPRVRRHT